MTNTDLPSTTLVGGYVARMAGWDSLSDKASRSQFQSMSRSALGGAVDASVMGTHVGDNGVYVLAGINNSIKDLTLQAWEYYAVDVINAVYLQADYKIGVAKDMDLALSGQFYNIEGLGETKDLLSKLGTGKVDYSVYGAKASLSTPVDLTPYIAYNKISEQKDNNGGTCVFAAWGGIPEFTQTEELWSSGANLNNASIIKVGADYSLEKIGLGTRTIGVAYTSLDLKNAYQTDGVDNDRSVLDIVYTCSGALLKNLDARVAYTSLDSKNNSNDRQLFKVMLNYNF